MHVLKPYFERFDGIAGRGISRDARYRHAIFAGNDNRSGLLRLSLVLTATGATQGGCPPVLITAVRPLQ